MWGTPYWKVYICQELNVCSLRWPLEALFIVRRGKMVRIALEIGFFFCFLLWLWRKLRIAHSGKVRSWVHLKCLKCCIQTRMFITEHLNLSGKIPLWKMRMLTGFLCRLLTHSGEWRGFLLLPESGAINWFCFAWLTGAGLTAQRWCRGQS